MLDVSDILQEIEIKHGEYIEVVPQSQVIPMFIEIILGMLKETRIHNKYLKERLDKCQH